jgi:hypothetical protein
MVLAMYQTDYNEICATIMVVAAGAFVPSQELPHLSAGKFSFFLVLAGTFI